MKIKHLLYIFLIIAITPIVTNYILTREIICNYDVAGTGVDWINFYGSFLGSALSAFIAYYVLLKTIENENRENLKRQKRQELDWLRDDLSERISKLEVTDVFRALLYNGDLDINQELERLTNLLYEYKVKTNSSMLKYGTQDDEECKEFFDEYNTLITDICIATNKMMTILSKYMYNSDKEGMMRDLSVMKVVMEELNKRPQFVYKRAETYYIAKKRELEKIENQEL